MAAEPRFGRSGPRSSRRRPSGWPGWSDARRWSATRGCPRAGPTSGSSAKTCRSCRSYKIRGAYNLIAQLDGGRARARRRLRERGQPRPGAGVRAAPAWASRAGCSCREPRRGRSASGSRRSAATTSGRGHGRRPTTSAAAAAAADAADRGDPRARLRRPRTIAGQGTVAAGGRRAARRVRPTCCVRAGRRRRAAGRLRRLAAASGTRRARGRRRAGGARPAWPRLWRRPAGRLAATLDTFVDGAAVRRAGGGHVPAGPRAAPSCRRSPRARLLRDAGDVPVRRDHRRARRRAGRGALGGVVRVEPPADRGLRRLRRQQRRQPLRRDPRAVADARGPKHYFLVEFPQEPGALRRFLDEVLGPGRRHHPVRVRQAQQPRDRPGPGRHRTRPAGGPAAAAGADGRRSPRTSSRSRATARCSGSCSPAEVGRSCIRACPGPGTNWSAAQSHHTSRKGNDDVTQPTTDPRGRARSRRRRRPQLLRRTHKEGRQQRPVGRRLGGRQGGADLRQLVRRHGEGGLRRRDRRIPQGEPGHHGQDRHRALRQHPDQPGHPFPGRQPTGPVPRLLHRHRPVHQPGRAARPVGDLDANRRLRARPLGRPSCYNGKPYGVPHQIDTTAILYRKDAFAAAGITNVPTTLDEAWTWDAVRRRGAQAAKAWSRASSRRSSTTGRAPAPTAG